jgi:hypothetical protein
MSKLETNMGFAVMIFVTSVCIRLFEVKSICMSHYSKMISWYLRSVIAVQFRRKKHFS